MKESNAVHYIYVAFYANGIPCYVGKGKGDRWQQHMVKSHNKRLAGVVRKANGSIPIVKVREHLIEAEAFAVEIALIAAIGRVDLGTGPLLNLTSGGDGVVGHKRTLEQRRQMSITRKGIWNGSPETARKISAALRNVPKAPAHCKAVSAAKKGKPGKPQSEETKLKRSLKLRGRKRSAEALLAVQNGQNALRADPVRSAQKSARITAKLTGKKLSPAHCAAIGDAQRNKPKGKWSKERRKRQSDRKKGIKLGPLKPSSLEAKRAKMILKGTASYREKPSYRAAMRMGQHISYDRRRISEYAKWGLGASAGLL